MPYLKITNLEENHFGFQYKDGLNVDPKPFNPNPKMDWGEGGLYFTDEQHILEFLHHDGWLRVVEIPSDAKVVHIGDQSRADKIILKEKYDLHAVNTWRFLEKIGIDLTKNAEKIAFWSWKFNHVEILKYLISKKVFSKEKLETCILQILTYDNGVKAFLEYNTGIKTEFYTSAHAAFAAYQQKFPDENRKKNEIFLRYLFDLYINLNKNLTSERHLQWLILAISHNHLCILPYFDEIDINHLQKLSDTLNKKEQSLYMGMLLLFTHSHKNFSNNLKPIVFDTEKARVNSYKFSRSPHNLIEEIVWGELIKQVFNDYKSILCYPIDIIYAIAAREGYIEEMKLLENAYINNWGDPELIEEERYDFSSNAVSTLDILLYHTIMFACQKQQVEVVEYLIENPLYQDTRLAKEFQEIFEIIEDGKQALSLDRLEKDTLLLLLVKTIKHTEVFYYDWDNPTHFIDEICRALCTSSIAKQQDAFPFTIDDFASMINALIKYDKFDKQSLKYLVIYKVSDGITIPIEFRPLISPDFEYRFRLFIDYLFEVANELNNQEVMEYLMEIS